MTYSVTAQFFRASSPEKGNDIPGILRDIAKAQLSDRERQLSNDVVLRLESFSEDGDFLEGDLCRKQLTGIPPTAGPQGLNEMVLEDGQGLGYLAAFAFHVPTRCILLERNKMSASKVRLSLYLKKLNPDTTFTFEEVVNPDVWDRFKESEVRSLKFGISNPENLEALADNNFAAIHSARKMAEAYNGLSISIDIGVGHVRNAHLNKGPVRKTIEALIKGGARRVQAVVEEEDGSSIIDFLGDQLKAQGVIEFEGVDPNQNYVKRRNFLRSHFHDSLPYLLEMYEKKK